MAESWAEELRQMYAAAQDVDEEFEVGVHRLVDVGPDGKRQTAFAAVSIAGEDPDPIGGGYGAQVRSYVRSPYTVVTDLRTSLSVEDVAWVLSGNVDVFWSVNRYVAALDRRRSDGRQWVVGGLCKCGSGIISGPNGPTCPEMELEFQEVVADHVRRTKE